jgi:hypothetical protein
MFEKRVLRVISGTKREEVAEDWKRVYNEELHNLYASPNTTTVIGSRRMKWAGHIACMEEMKNSYKVLIRKPEGKRQLRRPGCKL